MVKNKTELEEPMLCFILVPRSHIMVTKIIYIFDENWVQNLGTY